MADRCKKKLHAMTDDNVLTERGRTRDGAPITVRRCKACRFAGSGAAAVKAREVRARELSELLTPIMAGKGGWEESGLCRGQSWEKFIPYNVQPIHVQLTVSEFCNVPCPVRSLCLGQALAYGDVSGIWGGLLLPQQIMEVDVEKLIEEIT